MVGIAILGFLLYKVGFSQILEAFTKLNPLYLIPYLLAHSLSFFTGAINIKFLSDTAKKLSFKRVFKLNILSWSIGQFFPAKLGEFSIAYFFRKEGMKLGEGLAVAFMDKIITTMAVAFLALIGFTIYFKLNTLFFIFIYLLLILLGFFLLSPSGINILKKHLMIGPLKKLHGFIDVVAGYFNNQKPILLANSSFTLIKWMIMAAGSYYLFLGFGYNVNIIDVLLINAMGTIVSLIPISLSGLGIRESATVFLFTQLGVPAEIALSVALIQLIINYITAVGALSFARIK